MRSIYLQTKKIIFRIFPFLDRNLHTKQFIKFGIVGGSNFVIDFTAYLLFTKVFGIYFVIANIVSFCIAVSWSFYWNKRWTFQVHGVARQRQYIKFFVVNIIGAFVHTSLLYVLVTFGEWNDIMAKLLAIFVVMFWNFFITKLWAFK